MVYESKKMNKNGHSKLLAAVAVFAMVACVFAVAMPAEEADAFSPTYSGESIIVLGTETLSGEGYEYAPAASETTTTPATLTLSGYNGTKGFTYNGDLTVVVSGENKITVATAAKAGSSNADTTNGVRFAAISTTGSGALTIVGDGVSTTTDKLTVNVTGATSAYPGTSTSSEWTYGINSAGALSISHIAVDIDVATTDKYAFAVTAGGDQTFTNVTGTIDGGNRAIQVASGKLSIVDSDLVLTGGEKAVQAKNSGTEVEIKAVSGDGSTVEARLNSSYGAPTGITGGDDDGYGIKAQKLTVDAKSRLTTDGLRIMGAGSSIHGTLNVDDYEYKYTDEVPPALYYAPGFEIDGSQSISIAAGAVVNSDAPIRGAGTVTLAGDATLSGTFEKNDGDQVPMFNPGTYEVSVPAGETLDISATATSNITLIVGANSQTTLPSGCTPTVSSAAPGAAVTIAPSTPGGTSTPVDLSGATGTSTVTDFAGLKQAVEVMGFTDIVVTGTATTINENFTLPEGTTLTVDASSSEAKITVSGATFTVANGSTVILKDGASTSASIDVREGASLFVGGFIIGPEGATQGKITNAGTVSFDNSAEVKTNLEGAGTYNLSDAMKTVYIREDVNSNLEFLPQQTVVVEAGQSITISATSKMEVKGKLIIEEGATINITKGGLLWVHGNTASAEIAGTIVSNGQSIMKAAPADASTLAGLTIDISAAVNDDSVIDISGSVESKSCDNQLAINLVKETNGSIELSGKLTVSSRSAAAFNGLEVLEGGALTVNGTINDDTQVTNAGSIVMNGAVGGTFTVNMEIGGAVDVKSVEGTMNITDSGMYLSMVRNGNDTTPTYVGTASWSTVNSLSVTDVKGALITSDAPYEQVTGQENRVPVNKMYLSGNITECKKDIGTAKVTLTAGKVIVPDLEAENDMTLGVVKFAVNSDATLDVVGYIQAVNENLVLSGTGNILVSAGTIRAADEITTGITVTAVHYEAVESGETFHYYTTLAKAIDAGATDMDALGILEILESITLPAGTSLDAGQVNVGSDDVQDIAFTIADGAEFNAGNVYVYATMDVADVDDMYVNGVYSDTETIDGNHAVYTNLANALANAQDGTVSITKRGDGIVYLSTNATVKEGVTLAIPAGKTLEIKNGVTLTVAGTVDNKGVVSAYYISDRDEVMEGQFGTTTGVGADSAKRAVIALDGGLIQSTTSMPYATYSVAGAYYTTGNGKAFVVTTIERAAPVIGDVDAKTVSTYGKVTGTAATFAGEEYYPANLEINGDLTMDSLVLKDTVMTVKAASVLNGTYGSAEGTVKMEHVVAAAGFYMSDRIVETGDVKTPTLFVSGSVTKDKNEDYAFMDALVQFDGVVKVVNMTIDLDGTISGIRETVNGDVVVASGADVSMARNATADVMSVTLNNLDFIVEGTFTVSNDASLTSTDNVTNVVLGTLDIAAKTDSKNAGTATISKIYIGGEPKDITFDANRYAINETLGASAAVNGTMTGLDIVYLFPGSTVAEKNVEKFFSTTFNVGDVEVVTVYAKSQVTLSEGDGYVYPASAIGNSLFKGWMYYDDNNVLQYTSTPEAFTGSELETYTKVTIGQYENVYASVNDKAYILEFHVDAGVDAIYVDGDIVDSKGLVGQVVSGTTVYTYYPTTYVSAGEHTITVKLSNGYTGVVEMSFEGATVTDGKITIDGNSYANSKFVVSITNIDATGDTGAGDEMGLTDYLLIVLVILIVVMAIMVALRLMRS